MAYEDMSCGLIITHSLSESVTDGEIGESQEKYGDLTHFSIAWIDGGAINDFFCA